MAYEIAKVILEHADTVAKRVDAIKAAMSLGMPLEEIQDYLDWLDVVRPPGTRPTDEDDSKPESP